MKFFPRVTRFQIQKIQFNSYLKYLGFSQNVLSYLDYAELNRNYIHEYSEGQNEQGIYSNIKYLDVFRCIFSQLIFHTSSQTGVGFKTTGGTRAIVRICQDQQQLTTTTTCMYSRC